MDLLFQSLGFGVLFGLGILIANYNKENKLWISHKYFFIGGGVYFIYQWCMDAIFK